MTVSLWCAVKTSSMTSTSSIKSCNQNLLQDKHDQQKSAQATTTHLRMNSRPPLNTCYWWDTQNLGKISCYFWHLSEAATGNNTYIANLNSVDLLCLCSHSGCTWVKWHAFIPVQKECVILSATLLSWGSYHCCSSLSAVLSQSHSCFFSRRITPTKVLVTRSKFRDTQV